MYNEEGCLVLISAKWRYEQCPIKMLVMRIADRHVHNSFRLGNQKDETVQM